VPAAVSSIPLVDEQGRVTDLAGLRGRVVVLVPFMTSCQEVCPITTGVLLQVQRALAGSGVTSKVAVVEASVDPGRDTPVRLAAYAHLTGAHWPLLTAGAPALDALWGFFGVDHTVVPEGSPPGIDWESGRPYTYDVDHSDGFVLLDARGHERFSTGGMPHTVAPLSPALRSMLDDQGRANLASPGPGSWNAGDVVDGVGWLLDRQLSGGT
jgi:protein SCO1/2